MSLARAWYIINVQGLLFGGQFGSKMLNVVHKKFFNEYKGSIMQNE